VTTRTSAPSARTDWSGMSTSSDVSSGAMANTIVSAARDGSDASATISRTLIDIATNSSPARAAAAPADATKKSCHPAIGESTASSLAPRQAGPEDFRPRLAWARQR
jgi:hypothetical protein